MTPALEVNGLVKSYKRSGQQDTEAFRAVDGLSFSVMPGDIFGFLGPNGAGKSTTIRMLLGLIRPDSGDIRYFGKSFSTHRTDCLRRIGAIVEKPDFYRYLSAIENLKFFGSMCGADISSRNIDKVIELVGLTGRGKDHVKNYSHGMKQRLGLAVSLLHDPELVILDEPTTGLDPQGIVDLRQMVLQLKEQDRTVFMSSHILSEIELVATRLVILSKGKAVVEGSVADLLDADDLVAEFTFQDPEAAFTSLAGTAWEKKFESRDGSVLRFRTDLDDTSRLNSRFCSVGIPPVGVSSRRKLEDYFMKLTR
jgi:ABC-type multidrug transport system ATPase subunit